MEKIPNCPKCNSTYAYVDSSNTEQELYNCPECAHEWSPMEKNAAKKDSTENLAEYRDANGNLLKDGDTVSLIKDLKIKGTSKVIKVGTKVKNIRLVNSDHDIDCKVPGFGPMKLKSEFVKKT